MKECYFDLETRVIADLIPPREEGSIRPWLISRINVPHCHRGQGLGTKILSEILTDADAEGVWLELWPSPSGPLDYQSLVAWYTRHGFEELGNKVMLRKPQETSEC